MVVRSVVRRVLAGEFVVDRVFGEDFVVERVLGNDSGAGSFVGGDSVDGWFRITVRVGAVVVNFRRMAALSRNESAAWRSDSVLV